MNLPQFRLFTEEKGRFKATTLCNEGNMAEILARNRAVRAGNRGVVTKLAKEGEQHVKHCSESQQDEWGHWPNADYLCFTRRKEGNS